MLWWGKFTAMVLEMDQPNAAVQTLNNLQAAPTVKGYQKSLVAKLARSNVVASACGTPPSKGPVLKRQKRQWLTCGVLQGKALRYSQWGG